MSKVMELLKQYGRDGYHLYDRKVWQRRARAISFNKHFPSNWVDIDKRSCPQGTYILLGRYLETSNHSKVPIAYISVNDGIYLHHFT